ncbi:MAG TPA: serine/threonine-protein kinase [Gaiellaceae bacterium]
MRQGDEVVGRYRLDELQGRGPMSEVWRAHDRTLDRTVALKILSPTADIARFRREAQAVAALAHENVMRVYDYGEDEAGPFMALEWLPGGTLEDRLAHGPLPPDAAHRIAEGIAAGLAHLHARDLVHRDLKPANVLFDEEGRPKLGDFGLVRHTAGSGTLTEAGTVLGTAAYISPEQAVGEPAGAASDVYSFGVVLFRMLTGALPFTADNALALVDMHRHAAPPAVETLQPDAPPALAALTAAALRKDPAQRPADGGALLDALGGAPTAFLESDTEATRVLRPQAEQPAGGRGRRSAAAIAAMVVFLAVAGGVLAWAVTRSGTPAPGGGPKAGSVADTHGRRTDTTRAAPATTGSNHTNPRRQPTTTAGHTTTSGTTIAPPTTATLPTTAPTTTLGTTTALPTTTAPTTTLGTTTLSGTT